MIVVAANCKSTEVSA